MTSASRYWTQIKIDATGNYRFIENIEAKVFFRQLFPDINESEVSDVLVQGKLVQLMRASEIVNNSIAKYCLHCFISYQSYQVCQNLAAQFGKNHGFTTSDLLVFVLDDDSRPDNSSYHSLASEILDSFDPEKSRLATWATRLVKHHKELNKFLLQYGVYLVSDWAILNDTSSQQLQQISEHLSAQLNLLLTPENLLTKLQEIASHLRKYRIHVRDGSLPTESIFDTNQTSNNSSAFNWIDNSDEPDEQTNFLIFYRQQLLSCLDDSLTKLTNNRVKQLKRKDPEKAQNS